MENYPSTAMAVPLDVFNKKKIYHFNADSSANKNDVCH